MTWTTALLGFPLAMLVGDLVGRGIVKAYRWLAERAERRQVAQLYAAHQERETCMAFAHVRAPRRTVDTEMV